MNNNPLVSVCVVAYNSAEYITATLDSVKSQTYQNIELIISDDGSIDDTVIKCKTWLESNASRFVRTELVTVPKNTGTAGNYNRAVEASTGEYLKMLDADDLLLEDCIELNVRNVGDADLLISRFEFFWEDKIKPMNDSIDFEWFCGLPPQKRVHYYARTLFFANPITHFMKRTIHEKVGMYDLAEPLLEDVPFLLKVFESDAKLKFVPIKTIRYRSGGISNHVSVNFEKILLRAFFNYRQKHLCRHSILDRLLILERKFYSLILNVFNGEFIIKLYYSKYNIIYTLLNKQLYKK